MLVASTGIPLAHAAFIDAVERIKPSVVAVGTYQKTRSPGFAFRASGFAVGDGTLIATAAHAVPDALPAEAREAMNRETMMVLVYVSGSREPQSREAKIVAVDRLHDVALLRVGGAPLPAVKFGNSEAVKDGQSVAFTGFPIGNSLGFYPVTHLGIIASQPPIAVPGGTGGLNSSVVQVLKSGPFVLFELDATAYPGHSGSPLYDAASGEVIGVVNMGLVKRMKDAAIGQPSGISFAVPAHHLQDLIREAR
jgi:serine protease Do